MPTCFATMCMFTVAVLILKCLAKRAPCLSCLFFVLNYGQSLSFLGSTTWSPSM